MRERSRQFKIGLFVLAAAAILVTALFAFGVERRLVRKVKLEIAVNENFVEPTVRAIARAARLDGGRAGDGKVFVLPLEDVVRIRTGERGPEAI